MTRVKKAVALFAALAVLATPLSMASAVSLNINITAGTRRMGVAPSSRTSSEKLVDCHGWRNYNGFWDPSCFSMQYMPAQFACSGRGGRR